MNFSPFISVDRSCDETLQWSMEQLRRLGLRPVQTFDLNTARGGFHDCSCPNHGTDECDCQLVVLLVYGNTDMPETLILHGNGGQTWLSMTGTLASNVTGSLTELIKATLIKQEFIQVEISE